ncbi:MAG: hypothetical protein IJD10_05320 [Clostridia bacterium]|nr:hypothetical protein [Clostridia bacterium]
MAEISILPEQTVSGFVALSGENEGLFSAFLPLISLVSGETYKVYWNGTIHECVADTVYYLSSDVIWIGNLSLLGLGDDTEEEFLIGVTDYPDAAVYTTRTESSHTMAIYYETSDIIPKQELTFTLDESNGIYYLAGNSLFNMLALTVGEEYHVLWGEDVYNCTADNFVYNEIPCVGIGNAATAGGTDTGEPFAIVRFIMEGTDVHNHCMIAALDGSAAKVVRVYEADDVSVVLKDRNGNDVVYKGVKTVVLSDANGNEVYLTLKKENDS